MNAADGLRQFGPMIFMVAMMFLINIVSMLGPSNGANYNYSLGHNYQYREQLNTFRINQPYFVTSYTLRDFKDEPRLKQELDKKVEEDILINLERSCNGAKQKR